MNGEANPSPDTLKKKRRSTAGEAFVDMFMKPIKRKDSLDSDAKEEAETSSEEEDAKKKEERKRSKSTSSNLSTSLASSPKEEVKRQKLKSNKNSSSCGDVGQLAEASTPPEKRVAESPSLGGSGAGIKTDKDATSASSRKEGSSIEKKDSVKMKRGSIPYMVNKFDIPKEEVENIIRDFRSVLHKKVIHHGVMYIYPSYICWLSNSHSTKAKIPFSIVTNIKKNPMSVTVEVEMNGYPKIYKFSHLYKKTVTHKVLTLVWRHSKGDKSVSLDEIRSNKTLQDISLDAAADAESDLDIGSPPPEEISDEDIVLPPVGAVGEKPPTYDKGPLLSVVFPVSIAKFWHYFLSDESTHYKDAHIVKGDKDPTLTPWEAVEGGWQRVLEVKADVKSKVVKGYFPIHSVQKCYMLDAEHMIKEVESTQEGVPYSNDFINKGYWEITSLTKDTTEVKIWLWVVFIKSPLVKAIIEKSSISGMKDFTVVWLGEAHKRLKRRAKGGAQEKEGETEPTEDEPGGGLEIKGAEKSSFFGDFGISIDWKLGAILVLFGLLLVVTTVSYFWIASLRADNERLVGEVTVLMPKNEGGEVGGGKELSADTVQAWQKEMETLKDQIEKLQNAMATWVKKK